MSIIDSRIIYVGETTKQDLRGRLHQLWRSLFEGKPGHSGGLTLRRKRFIIRGRRCGLQFAVSLCAIAPTRRQPNSLDLLKLSTLKGSCFTNTSSTSAAIRTGMLRRLFVQFLPRRTGFWYNRLVR